MKKIGILGAGQMGAGIAYLLGNGKKNLTVNLWDRTPEVLSVVLSSGESPHLPGMKFQNVFPTPNLEQAVRGMDLLVLAVPSFAVREMAGELSVYAKSLPPILMISKGLEKDTALLPFQVMEEILGPQELLHITGVGYPKELASPRPVTELLASKSESLLSAVKSLFENEWLTIATATDLLGAQLAGALKNVIVIAIGLSTAGEKEPERKQELISHLVARGVAEMKLLGAAMGAKSETFDSPAGEGDLRFSADPLSRNFRLGEDVFLKGAQEVKKGLEEKKITVEGLLSSFAAHRLTENYGLNLPIVEAVYKVIYEGGNPETVVKGLLS